MPLPRQISDVARGIPPVQFFNALLCNAAGQSTGRQMSAHVCDPGPHVKSIKAYRQLGYAPGDLDLIIPHQANGRIIEAVRARPGCEAGRVRNDVRLHGNTSSSTIPLSLAGELAGGGSGRRIGLCAFGAGFTFGAAVLETG
ncbi:MAG TPA: 3-oxoacyl-[acyl-carrier-protein] synthase III C-terminal domain-containing protein [Tepidisphaeraceae bacterium]|nr:3-oxoacyl-[acyl-carrier-protein] synthase III C-terminal domain-containing protein [Tepidisphaeraceae bacterium]